MVRTSVRDVLDACRASRGAGYYYVRSKDDLLDAMIDRDATAAETRLTPIVDDPTADALGKLRALLAGLLAPWFDPTDTGRRT